MSSRATHHPEGEYLLDYATGAAPQSVSLLIATHLALCPECRRAVRAFEAVVGERIEEKPLEPAPDIDPKKLPAQDVTGEPSRRPRGAVSVFPEPLRSIAGGDPNELMWRRTLIGTHEIILPNKDGHELKLVQLPHRSLLMPAHTHGGSELMLVLQGAFKDQTGRYGRGDVSNGDPSLVHRPIAVGWSRCICLTVVDAPLQPVGLRARGLKWLRSRAGGR